MYHSDPLLYKILFIFKLVLFNKFELQSAPTELFIIGNPDAINRSSLRDLLTSGILMLN